VEDVARKRGCGIPDGTPNATLKNTVVVQKLKKGINLM